MLLSLSLSRARIGLYAAFAGLGGTAATIPALVPALGERTGESVIAAIPLLFGGLLVGVLASSPLLARLRASTVVAAGALVQAIALLGFTLAASLSPVLVLAALAGVGFGLSEAAGSVAAKRSTDASAARILTSLTAALAVVAALSPVAIAFAPGGVWLVPLLIGALQLLACGALLGAPEHADTAKKDSTARDAASTGAPVWTRAARRIVLLAGLTIALYVGVETVFSGWSAVIPSTILDIDPQIAALGTTGYWLCMAAGRFLATALLRRGLRPAVLLTVCMTVAASALLVMASLAGSPFVLVALGVAIVAMAPVYSLVLGEALDRLSPAAAARAIGPLVACGAVGGTVLPVALVVVGLGPTDPATTIAAAVIYGAIAVGALVLAVSTHPKREHALAPTPALVTAPTPSHEPEESTTP